MTKVTVKEICEKIWQLENKYDLLNKDIQGAKVWQISRFIIYSEIAQRTGVYTQAHTTINNNLLDKVKLFPSYLYNSIFKNPLLGNYQKDILILDHPRKMLIDGEYIDIYTKYLLDELDDNAYDVVEDRYLNKHLSKKEKNRKYLDYISLVSYLFNKKYKPKFTDDESKWIINLENEINSYFGIDLDFIEIFSKRISHFKSFYEFYNKLLEKKSYTKIYTVISYSTIIVPLIAAAKANNIQVIEIQHGTISPYHLGYNFPTCKHDLDYFPDIFYSFGTYWQEVVDFPIDKKNVIPYGLPYLKERMKIYKNIKKNEKQILFISQGVIGKELSQFAYESAQVLGDYKFVYKLHPGEYDRWKDEYDELVLASKLDNVEVVGSNEKELYSYLAESEYQIGVSSTAIYEGLIFNCKTLLIDLPGIEYMKYLIEKNIASKINNVTELKYQLEHFEPIEYDERYFFT